MHDADRLPSNGWRSAKRLVDNLRHGTWIAAGDVAYGGWRRLYACDQRTFVADNNQRAERCLSTAVYLGAGGFGLDGEPGVFGGAGELDLQGCPGECDCGRQYHEDHRDRADGSLRFGVDHTHIRASSVGNASDTVRRACAAAQEADGGSDSVPSDCCERMRVRTADSLFR